MGSAMEVLRAKTKKGLEEKTRDSGCVTGFRFLHRRGP